VCIAGYRRAPVRLEGFTYLFLLRGLLQVLLGFHVQLPLGINPGTPVSTTALNLCRVLIPSLISFIASSGSMEMSKFSLMRLGVLDVVRRAVPRCTAHASSTLTKSCFQRDRGRLFGVDGVGNQRAKTERGDHSGSIHEGYLRIAKAVAFYGRFHMRHPTLESSYFLSARR